MPYGLAACLGKRLFRQAHASAQRATRISFALYTAYCALIEGGAIMRSAPSLHAGKGGVGKGSQRMR